ncbi:type 2 isopentenyl-diphosphate Delta-isomerase [Dendrosporobacter sp. 1207_IL3150]|uniref:type 2 isopentenyl-diphosphate Delta-isomerase n=1 Tax=Dendrosporobacter sp. 1207_IL3150 TaxID=3084054 RepID=UPI002FD8A9DB
MRESRKLDHIKHALKTADGPQSNRFEDFKLIHNCLPKLAWDEIDLSCTAAGLKLSNPIIINAITGGANDITDINAKLAEFANITGCAIAVGSQFAAIENKEVTASYRVVRRKNPSGIVIANLGAYAKPEHAQQAIEMLEADALQIHLNPAQEIIMAEGDRDFTDYLENITKIAQSTKVPVIAKEVGCGIAKEQAKMLVEAGVKAIDVGGAGGTNFIAIEAARTSDDLDQDMLSWGIPTAISAVETASVLPSNVDLIISGGIRTPLEAVKAFALNAKAIGIANPILKTIKQHGLEKAAAWFEGYTYQIKRYMLLTGAKNLSELTNIPIIITGPSFDWLSVRGADPSKYALRSKT